MWPLLDEVGEGEQRHEYTTRQEHSRASWLIPFYAIHSYISILVQHHILQDNSWSSLQLSPPKTLLFLLPHLKSGYTASRYMRQKQLLERFLVQRVEIVLIHQP